MPAWFPNDIWVRWLLVPAVAFIAMASNTAYLADFWHHLARGREIAQSGQLLDHDVFTFTVADRPFRDVNWLSQIAYHKLFELGGLGLVRVVNALETSLTLLWLMVMCRRLSGSLPIAMGVAIAVFLGLWEVLSIRPQTFSLLLFVVMYDALDRSEKSPAWLVVCPLVMPLWANVHGAFPAGIILIGCFWAAAGIAYLRGKDAASGKRFLALTVCLVIASLATLLNPYGWEIYRYVSQTSHLSVERRIDEWLPPSFTHLAGIAWYLSLAGFAGIVFLTRSRRPLIEVREFFLLACFFYLSATSVRMAAWWFVILAPMAATRLALIFPKSTQAEAQPNLGATISCAVLLLLCVLSVPSLHAWNPLLALRPADRTQRELEIADATLATYSSPLRVFSKFEWGEYLAWAGHPTRKVFMDGRIEIYPDDVWRDYANVTEGKKEWHETLDRYGVDVLVLDLAYHGKTGLLAQVEQSPSWRNDFSAGNIAIFVRKR